MAKNARHQIKSQLRQPHQSFFGTDGIRGRVGTVITPALVLKLGYWCGQILPREGPILIGQDSRQSSSMVTAALTAGLTAAGREVLTLGLCPTPAVASLIKKLKAAGGLMVSASHNPPEDNGIKVFGADGSKINATLQSLIETRLKSESIQNIIKPVLTSFGQSYQCHQLLKHYKEELINSVNNKRLDNVPIVLDLCWGSATACGEEVFKAIGANVKVLHGEPNGKRINVGCGSTHLEPLRKAVLEEKAEMGFAFDGDSDRVLAVDGKGRVVNGDHILYLWGSTLQKSGELPDEKLVATVMSNLGFERAWQARGGRLERTPVGDQHVHAAMMNNGAALGGEQSGHILSTKNNLSGDGLLTALQIATLCKQQNLTLAEWLDQSFTAYPQKLINVPIPNQKRVLQECKPLKEALMAAEAAMGENGRVLVRASGTEPLLRVMVEAIDPHLVDSWTSQIAGLVEDYVRAA